MDNSANGAKALRKENISAIKELLQAVAEKNVKKMKDVANHVLREVPVTKDQYSIKISVISYSLSKIFNKDYYRKDEMRWQEFVIDLRNNLRSALERPENLELVFSDIKRLDESVGRFVSQVTDKGLSKKASTLYAYGLSLGTAAGLTGTSKWDVLKEIGQTKMSDEGGKEMLSLEKRFKLARQVLGEAGSDRGLL